jgi:hypothetical protein
MTVLYIFYIIFKGNGGTPPIILNRHWLVLSSQILAYAALLSVRMSGTH